MLYPSMTAHCDGHKPLILLEPGQRSLPIFETLPCDAEIVLPARFSTDTPAGVAYAIAHLEAQGWHISLDPADGVRGRDLDEQLTNGWATVTCPRTVTPDDYPQDSEQPLADWELALLDDVDAGPDPEAEPRRFSDGGVIHRTSPSRVHWRDPAPRADITPLMASALSVPAEPSPQVQSLDTHQRLHHDTPHDDCDWCPAPPTTEPTAAEETTEKPAPAKKKAAKPKPAAKRRTGRLSAAESERVNAIIRDALANGPADLDALATATGLSKQAVQKRIEKMASTAAAPAPAPAAKPKPAPIAPPPAPSKTLVDRHRVPALGARRRILSLYAIGYDHRILNARLSNTDVTVGAVLPLEDTDMIPQATFDAIDQLWQRLRTVPMTPNPAVNPDRSSPPPSAWTNIDDPNEQPEVKR